MTSRCCLPLFHPPLPAPLLPVVPAQALRESLAGVAKALKAAERQLEDLEVSAPKVGG